MSNLKEFYQPEIEFENLDQVELSNIQQIAVFMLLDAINEQDLKFIDSTPFEELCDVIGLPIDYTRDLSKKFIKKRRTFSIRTVNDSTISVKQFDPKELDKIRLTKKEMALVRKAIKESPYTQTELEKRLGISLHNWLTAYFATNLSTIGLTHEQISRLLPLIKLKPEDIGLTDADL